MAERAAGSGRSFSWRALGWGSLAALLALPAIAMRFTPEVNWTAFDFVVMGAMLGSVGVAIELAVRWSADRAYRAGAALAVLGGFLLLWINLAVGVIGTEDDPANRMYVGVLALGLLGAIAARARAAGLNRTLVAMAVAQSAAGLVALVGRIGLGSSSWPWDVVGLTVIFCAIWLCAAALFRRAASRA